MLPTKASIYRSAVCGDAVFLQENKKRDEMDFFSVREERVTQ